jgi:hypothetical protein
MHEALNAPKFVSNFVRAGLFFAVYWRGRRGAVRTHHTGPVGQCTKKHDRIFDFFICPIANAAEIAPYNPCPFRTAQRFLARGAT